VKSTWIDLFATGSNGARPERDDPNRSGLLVRPPSGPTQPWPLPGSPGPSLRAAPPRWSIPAPAPVFAQSQ